MSRKYLQTKKTSLSYSISDSETAFRLEGIYKLDGTSISASDIGDYMTFTIDPGTSKEEICSVASTGVTVNADGTVDLTSVVRGLQEVDPYTTGGYSAEHGAGAVVVFSNNPQLYNQLANKSNSNTFTALNIFSGYAPQTDTDPVAGNDLTRLSYVQALVLGTLTTIDVVVPGTAGETLADGNLIYLNTDNKWYKTDADTASTVNNVLLGIAKGAGTTNNPITNGVLLQGVDDAQSGLTAGQIQYASNTAGAISNTPGTTEVTVGVAKSTTELYFSPRFNQMLTEDQQDAMAGANSPSATNVFLTNNDTTGTGSVVRESVLSSIAGTLFGDGSDGNVTISAGTTTISRDMYYNNLTIETGGTLNPSGYRVFVKGTLTFQGTGKIARNGNNGGNGGNGANGVAGGGASAGGTAGTAGAALSAGTLAGAGIAGAGATGGAGTVGDATPGSAGAQAPAPSNVTTAVGSSSSNGGGAGGNGGGGFNGVAGGTGGALRNGATVTNPTIMPRTAINAIDLRYINDTTVSYMNGSAPAPGGASGGGGAGGNQGAGTATGGAGGGGGGGGGTGGIVMVAAFTVVGGYATCIQALGGTGGNGGNGGNGSANHAGAGGGGSGGTGGTGGVVCFIYHSYTGTALDTTCVAGGSGGTAGVKGTPGTNGGAGTDGVAGLTGATGKLYSFAV